jgi:hypothetical protein
LDKLEEERVEALKWKIMAEAKGKLEDVHGNDDLFHFK